MIFSSSFVVAGGKKALSQPKAAEGATGSLLTLGYEVPLNLIQNHHIPGSINKTTPKTMKSVYSLVSIAVVVLSCASVANAFAPQSGIATRKFVFRPTKTATMDFLGEQEKTSLTREDEPDEFFLT